MKGRIEAKSERVTTRKIKVAGSWLEILFSFLYPYPTPYSISSHLILLFPVHFFLSYTAERFLLFRSISRMGGKSHRKSMAEWRMDEK